MEAVRLDLDAGSPDIVAELDEGLGGLDGLGDNSRVGVVIALIAADSNHGHRAVGEPFLDLFSLIGVEGRLHLVGMGGPELDAEDLARCAVLDEGGKVPVLSPEVGYQPELHRRPRSGGGTLQELCR